MTALSSAALPTLSASVPTYDRQAASVGIVHFGFGNFHRSHVAMYLDRLMETGQGLDWGICGVGVLEQDAAMRDVMRAQDCLFTLVVRHPDGSLEPRVVGSVLEYLFGPDDATAVHRRLDDPAVRIVSLTVTEGGYLKNPATGDFDAENPAVVHDLAHPQDPRTAFAYIVEGLRRRRDSGAVPFTVLSCDNLQGNGDYARQAVVGFARLTDPELADLDRHRRSPSPTAWSTGSPRRPRMPTARPCSASSASTTRGRCRPSPSPSGSSRTSSPPAGRRWKPSACSSSTTCGPTS